MFGGHLFRKVKSPKPDKKFAYECCLCGRPFQSSNKVRRHIEMVHSEPTNEICPFCHKTYKNKHCLAVHKRTCSNRPYAF